jgi:hypothetical protein
LWKLRCLGQSHRPVVLRPRPSVSYALLLKDWFLPKALRLPWACVMKYVDARVYRA